MIRHITAGIITLMILATPVAIVLIGLLPPNTLISTASIISFGAMIFVIYSLVLTFIEED